MSVFRASTAVALIALVTAPALAAEVPSDPVERCKGLLTLAPADSPMHNAQVGSVESYGDSGCKFTDVKMTEPADKVAAGEAPTTVSIEELTVDKLDFAKAYDSKPSNTLTAQATGISIDNPQVKAVLGEEPFNVAVDYALDEATKQFTLTQFELSGDSLGALSLDGALDGIASADPATATDPAQLLGTASLRKIKLHFENKGIIDKVIAFATAQGEDPKTAIEQGKSQAVLGMAALSAIGVPEAAVKSLMAFAQDFPAPKGPLTITMDPAAPVPLAQFATIKPGDAASMDMVKSLNVAVSY
ncbi:hypothetical protein [Inquilinus sp.]|jgi:hypothetical protein|uniref:hypothetical protein n=1 Tax=Inquilinus sp. TaxID=1932117 RepID=UPI003784A6FD